jgi:hypothetical protein
MKFEDVRPGAIFIEKASLSPIGGKELPHLFIHVSESYPSKFNDSFQCVTLDVYENTWSDTFWKPNRWLSAGGGNLTEKDMQLIAKIIFTATNK